MNIRPARAEDAPGLAEVYVDSGRHHAGIDPVIHGEPSAAEAMERIRAKFADAANATFVAEEGGEVLGLLEIQLAPPPPPGSILRTPPAAHVGVSVRESRRGRGIGAALMQFAERWAVENGCAMMILDMSSANSGALRFYERLGYQTYGLLLRKVLIS